MLKKKTKIQESNNLPSFTTIVDCGSTTSASTTTVWKGGYVTDNFHSYYLDANMVKRYK